MKRLGISALSHGMLLLILALALSLDLLTDFSLLSFVLLTFSAMATQGAFWLLFHCRINLRFKDPSLTLMQMAVAIIWFSILISQLPEIRGSLTLLYIMVMLFGIFQISMFEFAFVGLLSLVCFGGVIASDLYFHPEEINLKLSLVQWLILASAQTWIALFGSYVRRLSERLKRQRSVLRHSNHKMQRANEELEQAMEQLDEIAGTDELTGVLNRRRFFEESRLRLAGTDEYQSSALCMIDLDHFKRVNDRFGHQAGDLVLERFCQITRECLRGSDLFGRYGGEEFILLLPQTNQESGVQIAERIRLAFEQYTFDSIEPGLRLSASIGATLHRWGETLEETLKRADKALYQAKSFGRNQTIYISGAQSSSRTLDNAGKTAKD
ncbi:hypothetical protein BTA35_0202165 [Oceanospirillum linum]|uniref:diguanylate cyclase n=2 Tax=Oceanospirillum linum TaxID=966 RepID=A0A1T1HES9_OCELI|nr:hypothetical protein BTA35_0202165 [Oceanospirillum linum]SEF52912.1 diguanylate cyclase (GGDEF) domain-containing protein [Oleiphilus messinensis]SMP04566.1 diguanylate cyclase (GGDEF) domain-containing protein [Oceanospirillum linum]